MKFKNKDGKNTPPTTTEHIPADKSLWWVGEHEPKPTVVAIKKQRPPKVDRTFVPATTVRVATPPVSIQPAPVREPEQIKPTPPVVEHKQPTPTVSPIVAPTTLVATNDIVEAPTVSTFDTVNLSVDIPEEVVPTDFVFTRDADIEDTDFSEVTTTSLMRYAFPDAEVLPYVPPVIPTQEVLETAAVKTPDEQPPVIINEPEELVPELQILDTVEEKIFVSEPVAEQTPLVQELDTVQIRVAIPAEVIEEAAPAVVEPVPVVVEQPTIDLGVAVTHEEAVLPAVDEPVPEVGLIPTQELFVADVADVVPEPEPVDEVPFVTLVPTTEMFLAAPADPDPETIVEKAEPIPEVQILPTTEWYLPDVVEPLEPQPSNDEPVRLLADEQLGLNHFVLSGHLLLDPQAYINHQHETFTQLLMSVPVANKTPRVYALKVYDQQTQREVKDQLRAGDALYVMGQLQSLVEVATTQAGLFYATDLIVDDFVKLDQHANLKMAEKPPLLPKQEKPQNDSLPPVRRAIKIVPLKPLKPVVLK